MTDDSVTIKPNETYVIAGGELQVLARMMNELKGEFAIPLNSIVVSIARRGPLPKPEEKANAEAH